MKIILPVLDNDIFSPKNSDDLYKLSTHWFTVRGGEKGITVFPNGVGNFNIIGAPGAKNILSFSQLSKNFDVFVNLNLTSQQTVAVYQAEIESKMALIQKNIIPLLVLTMGLMFLLVMNSIITLSLGVQVQLYIPEKVQM
ncbi:Efa1/LifA-like protein [Escherichia coli]|uniref:Efa1/LifA-like protein n=1 Tax=Escherichia coli TaxID=562 RepID=A0A376U7P2_ECOLX|nr:Efa1/LifA-like protein [Escherichia coli]